MRSYMSPTLTCPRPRYICCIPCSGSQPSVRGLHLGCRSQNLPDVVSGRKIEGPSHSETRSEEDPRRFKITLPRRLAGIGTLAFVGLIFANLAGGPSSDFRNNNPSNTTKPNFNDCSSADFSRLIRLQPLRPERRNEREVRIPDRRGLSVDISSESYPKSYQDGVADGLVTTVGHSETSSISDNGNQEK